MKIGMNSQTLRIIENDVIIDCHITDGLTSSYFMKILNGQTKKDMLKQYDVKSIDAENDPLSWGSDSDKLTDINYVDLENKGEYEPQPTETYDDYRHYVYNNQMCRPSPNVYTTPPQPKPRLDYSDTAGNEKNFKKLFGA